MSRDRRRSRDIFKRGGGGLSLVKEIFTIPR
jgi:hypothetical protein